MRYDEDDPWVIVWEGPTPDAERILARLDKARIPVDLEPRNIGHAGVVVPRSYTDDAQGVIAGVEPVWPDVRLDPQGRVDWHPAVRLALIVVVILVVAGLVFNAF